MQSFVVVFLQLRTLKVYLVCFGGLYDTPLPVAWLLVPGCIVFGILRYMIPKNVQNCYTFLKRTLQHKQHRRKVQLKSFFLNRHTCDCMMVHGLRSYNFICIVPKHFSVCKKVFLFLSFYVQTVFHLQISALLSSSLFSKRLFVCKRKIQFHKVFSVSARTKHLL